MADMTERQLVAAQNKIAKMEEAATALRDRAWNRGDDLAAEVFDRLIADLLDAYAHLGELRA